MSNRSNRQQGGLSVTPAAKPLVKRALPGIALLIVLVVAVVLWQQHRTAALPGGAAGAGQGAMANKPQPGSVALAQLRDVRVTVTAIGTIAAMNTAVVHTKVDGELKALYFKEGQLVRAGQVLALVDPQPYQIALTQAQGVLERDQATLRNAQLDLKRYADLVAKDAASKQQYDTQEALVQQLQGTVQTDQASVASAKLNLGYTRVVAPISGLAGLKQVDLGNMVRASDANGLLSIAQTQPVALTFSVPDSYLPRIRNQLKSGKPLAWDRAQTTMLAKGFVASTDNAIDTSTGTIRIKAQFANLDASLFANQFVNVVLQIGTQTGALAIPTAAIQRGAPGTYVYVVASDSSVNLQKVKVGATDGDWTSVQGAIQAGDQVIVDGADRLRSGAHVEIIAPAAPAHGASQADAHAHTAQERQQWMDKLPPDVRSKIEAMSPDERRAWLQKRREQNSGSN